jgi:hypothetical protein
MEQKEQTENQQAVIAALAEIAESNNGVLQVDAVIAAARAQDSPLHSKFTWDDTEAAHKWRQEQARALIRVTVKYLPENGNSVRVFVSLTTDQRTKGGGYRQLVSVMSNEEQRAQLLEDAYSDLQRFREKYSLLTELAEVFAAITAAEKKHKRTKNNRRNAATGA